MPLYDFECLDCGQVFETRLAISEVGTTHPLCPRCGGSRARRKINHVALKRGHSSARLTSGQMNAAAGFADTFSGSHGDHDHHDHGDSHEHHDH